MSVQDDKGHEGDQRATDEADDRQLTEKPEPDEEAKEKAAEMMTAYEDRPTLVLPGSAAMVTGTAVNDWLDEDGNAKHEAPEGVDVQANEDQDQEAMREQIEKDKALNEQLREASKAENKGEKN